MVNIAELKVIKFNGGEIEWVIARSYEEACEFYEQYLGESLETVDIEEVKDWHEIKVKCEASKVQEDGTYFEMRTMADLANETYLSKYTGAEIIATTCI